MPESVESQGVPKKQDESEDGVVSEPDAVERVSGIVCDLIMRFPEDERLEPTMRILLPAVYACSRNKLEGMGVLEFAMGEWKDLEFDDDEEGDGAEGDDEDEN